MHSRQARLRVFSKSLLPAENAGVNWDLIRERLQHLIAKRQTNPTALSDKCGVPQPTIWRFIEGDTGYMTLDNLGAIARALDASVAELIGEVPFQADEQIRRVVKCMERLSDSDKAVIMNLCESLNKTRERTPHK